VKVLPAGEKSRVYLAMEYVPGEPLRSLMEGYPMPERRAVEIACQVGDALAHMHAQGVVHRDIKPDNLIVTEDGRVKISDFGIALSRGARRLTWSGFSHSTGTPDYAAPEQIRGHRGDARTDVYALGVLLYELLTGHLPWEGKDLAQLLRAKRKSDATPPSAHWPGIDPALEAVVLRAISRDPADRQADAAELVADLRHPSAMEVRPRVRRNPLGDALFRLFKRGAIRTRP
jgi:serine/threonine-protein kinase